MRKWMLKFVLTVPLFLLLLPGQTCAQSFNATISGMITDPSGAAIPGAKLTLRALSTNTTATTAAGADGLYSFPNLVAGGFELAVQAPGFKDFVQHGIVLRINEQARLDVALQVGQAFQTVRSPPMLRLSITRMLNWRRASHPRPCAICLSCSPETSVPPRNSPS